MTVLALLALAVVLAAAWEIGQILRAHAPAQPAVRHLGPTAPESPALALPRIIWTYWDTPAPPPLIERCLANWRRFAPDHEVRLLDRSTALTWLPDPLQAAAWLALPPYRQADWLRLRLLHAHGGVWMDGSSLISRSLEWVHELHRGLGAGVVGFYIDRYTTDAARPMLENWFLAAPAGDAFIAAWMREFDHALALGEDAYLDELRAGGELAAAAQGIPASMQAYLAMHLAAARVGLREPGRHRMALQRAEDVAFAFHAALRWRKRHLYARLALTPAPARAPALIKLRGGDRAVVERGLAGGWWWRRSLLARLLELNR